MSPEGMVLTAINGLFFAAGMGTWALIVHLVPIPKAGANQTTEKGRKALDGDR